MSQYFSDKHSAVNNTYIFSIEIFILNIMRIIVVGAGIIGTTSAFRTEFQQCARNF